jgi:hydroxymethylbilane synthase
VLEALLKPLNHQPSYRAVLAERAVLAALNGGCTLPMAAWARDLADDEVEQTGLNLALDAAVFDVNGRECITVSLRGSHRHPEIFGKQVAKALLERGAERLLARIDSRA